jgi:hypothetical protein
MLTATVDLNPHQLDAALFALRSPLSRGAILADDLKHGLESELKDMDWQIVEVLTLRWSVVRAVELLRGISPRFFP